MQPKFPQVCVKLVGEDDNAFAILGKVQQAMRRAKIAKSGIDAYIEQAMQADYDHLPRLTMNTVTVE